MNLRTKNPFGLLIIRIREESDVRGSRKYKKREGEIDLQLCKNSKKKKRKVTNEQKTFDVILSSFMTGLDVDFTVLHFSGAAMASN